jgi:hypothetical protein
MSDLSFHAGLLGDLAVELRRGRDAQARVDVLEQAASNALVYLQNALSEDFARGSDKAVRVELAAVLGVEL